MEEQSFSKTNAIIIAGAVLAIAAIAVGWWYYQKSAGSDAVKENLGTEAAKGTLPSINTNPMENAPDTNPVSKTNPFSNLKTNPFSD